MRVLLLLFAFICYIVFTNGSCPAPVSNAVVPQGFCSSVWTTAVNSPRAITTASNGDVIVVESGIGQLSLFYTNSEGSLTKVALANATGLNHAVLIESPYIYASSSSTVYRWKYAAGVRTNLGEGEEVITGIPTGGHVSRSLIFSNDGHLLVQIGSGSNLDKDTSRSGIKQFDLSSGIPQSFSSANWFVQGLRNEVGLRKDAKGNIWGIENGMDDLNRADLGGDIHLGNPGEELNLLEGGQFYGYPYCWSQYNLSTVTTPRNTQYGVDPFLSDGTHSDNWCQNTSNVVKPTYQLHPHTAPLDLLFYYGSSFPEYSGDVFVAQHGSWDSQPPVGYRVSRIHFSNGVPVSDDPFFSYSGPGQTGPNWHRPVGLTIIKQNGADVLLVTSDATNTIIAIQYSPSSNTIKVVQ